MSEVKKYDPFGYDGLSAFMTDDPLGDYVRFEEYGTLKAERDQLKSELEALRATHPAPASVGGVEVVGWRRLDRPYELTAHPSVCAMWHGVGYPVQALYLHPAAAVPAADLVRQCIAEELASWKGDYRWPVGRALHDLQQRIDSALSAKP